MGIANNYIICFFYFIVTSFLLLNDSYANSIISEPANYIPKLTFSFNKLKNRNIHSIDFMLPILQKDYNLLATDIRVIKDNLNNVEYNLGLAYRKNFDDKFIVGIYSYLDRRQTAYKLYVSQWTLGTEMLSNYFDIRFNIYVPQNKVKTIAPPSRELTIEGTTIYINESGAVEEEAIPGYDIEIGSPLFSLFPKFNHCMDTKIYLAYYDFRKKSNIRNGTRIRIEHTLEEQTFFGNNYPMTFSIGTTYTNEKKWNSFVGLGISIPLSKFKQKKKNLIQSRMMEPIVRDIDIITLKRQANTNKRLPVYYNNKKIDNIYFVGEANDENYNGDGTYEKPFGSKQLMVLRDKGNLNIEDNGLVVPVLLHKEFETGVFQTLVSEYSVTNPYATPLVLSSEDKKNTYQLNDILPKTTSNNEYENYLEMRRNKNDKFTVVRTNANHLGVVENTKKRISTASISSTHISQSSGYLVEKLIEEDRSDSTLPKPSSLTALAETSKEITSTASISSTHISQSSGYLVGKLIEEDRSDSTLLQPSSLIALAENTSVDNSSEGATKDIKPFKSAYKIRSNNKMALALGKSKNLEKYPLYTPRPNNKFAVASSVMIQTNPPLYSSKRPNVIDATKGGAQMLEVNGQ